jgi:glutaminyl-peptide cyclotransferase
MKLSLNKEAYTLPAKTARKTFVLLLILTLPLIFTACPGGNSNRNNNVSTGATPAASPSPTNASPRLVIDGERAFEHVRKQVEIGPRPAGSAELARTREYIVGELKSYGLNVTVDEWQAKTPIGERKMANVTAELPGESSDVIILSSHYDTKLFKEFRFVGANDGASSTGALLEMARVMATSGQKPRLTYRFVFFDGEEAFCANWDDCQTPDGPDNTYGSHRYVKQLKEKNETRRVRAMILLDMIGYKNLELGRNEKLSTSWLIDAVWDAAKELGYDKYFIDGVEECDGDDHVPFLNAGIEALDIIQLGSYEYWHDEQDTLDKISPQSLKIVGDVVLASLPRIEQRILSRPAS